MRILIAPDKFKGSLTAHEVGEAIAAGLRDVLSEVQIELLPMADGGEGTAEAICNAHGGAWMKCRTHDPLGREIEARYGWLEQQNLSVLEMSEAAGMRRLRPNELDVDVATTFGVGEMMLDAARRGAREIIVGLGGSATNDGGFGMARALGFRFFAGDKELIGSVRELQTLRRVATPVAAGLSPANSRSQATMAPPQVKVIAAVDVRNTFLGKNGATRVFGPQKGATPDKIEILEAALTRLADVVAKEFGCDYRNEAGAGAAGGLGFGLMSFCGAKIRPGFDVVAEAVGLEAIMDDVDLVITGEGSLDRQTLEGKTPAGVARIARRLGKRVFAFVGRATEESEVRELFDGVFENVRPGMSEAENMQRAAELLRENARNLAKKL
jgi:glycerate kinase